MFGPADPQGQVWRSVDGATWEAIDTGTALDGAELRHAFVARDGSLMAGGWYDDPTTEDEAPQGRIWSSIDGTEWAEAVDLGGSELVDVAQGAHGYVAIVSGSHADGLTELWHSSDGRAWTTTLRSAVDWREVGAGPQGFVVIGSSRTGGDGREIIASADGNSWIPADNPPAVGYIVPVGSDWLATDVLFEGGVHFSEDGLRWTRIGTHPLTTIEIGDGGRCTEFIDSLVSLDEYVVSGTVVSYPCSEGASQTFGRVRQSGDGSDWRDLPLDGVPPDQQGTVTAGVTTDELRLLVGHSRTQATIWAEYLP